MFGLTHVLTTIIKIILSLLIELMHNIVYSYTGMPQSLMLYLFVSAWTSLLEMFMLVLIEWNM